MTEKELMTEALALAKLSFDEGEVPVGAVVALDGDGRGALRPRGNPRPAKGRRPFGALAASGTDALCDA